MSKLLSAIAVAALVAGVPAAAATVLKAESKTSGKMATGQTQMSTNMTQLDKKKWKACMSMTDSQMANDKTCSDLKSRGAGVGNMGMNNDGTPHGK